MSGSIRVSPKHGINPSLGVCFICGKDDGTIVLPGVMHRKDDRGVVIEHDVEAPHRACWSREPCPNCKGLMQEGIILISVDPKRSESEQDPYRSGGWCVVTESYVKRIFTIHDAVLRARMAFIEDEVWDKLGLPRGTDEKPVMVKVHPHLPEVAKDKPIQVTDEFGDAIGFDAKSFKSCSYLWWDGERLLVSLIEARQPWSGAFRRFVTRCQEFKVPLRVPTPVNAMPAILEKWGWTKSEEPHSDLPGEIVTVWDPPKEGPWTGKKESKTT
jgi:hypothetical protein